MEGKVIFPAQQRQSRRGELNFCLVLHRKTLPTSPKACAWESHAQVDGTVRQASWEPSVPAMTKVKATHSILRMLPS